MNLQRGCVVDSFVTGIVHQVILTELPGQELHVEVFDKDMDMKDDFMGRYSNI